MTTSEITKADLAYFVANVDGMIERDVMARWDTPVDADRIRRVLAAITQADVG